MNKEKSLTRFDLLVLIASLMLIVVSVIMMVQGGTLNVNLGADTKLSWHLVRSSGIVAYMMLLGSTVWGVFMSAQVVKDWSPGPVSLTMHSTISWLALLLSLVHALLLLLDDYFTYTLGDLFVPFTGPYRPEAVGLGTLAFWGILIITVSFWFKKQMGHKAWKWLHYVSYLTFVLVSAHGLFAGTEGTQPGFQILLGMGMAATLVLLGIRVVRSTKSPARVART
ncbi:MAG: ferric reductase-like transmembrane domain-containing protein [Anaerolineae bacterium]|nr:ferric reductase-like transmembrane domain-containing protein [Anaerolineae bacterium]